MGKGALREHLSTGRRHPLTRRTTAAVVTAAMAGSSLSPLVTAGLAQAPPAGEPQQLAVRVPVPVPVPVQLPEVLPEQPPANPAPPVPQVPTPAPPPLPREPVGSPPVEQKTAPQRNEQGSEQPSPDVTGQTPTQQPAHAPAPAPGAPESAPEQTGTAGGSQPSAGRAPVPESVDPGDVHVVRRGESLWAIASDLLGEGASTREIAREVDRLWRLNSKRISSGRPDLLMPGERLLLAPKRS